MNGFCIEPATQGDLPRGSVLLATTLGFAPADAIPAWLMQMSRETGAVALRAMADGEMIGFSFATPGRGADREPVLVSCGLAVVEAWRGRGAGLEIKHAQARLAREDGVSRIVWTADPMSGAALRLYTTKLGARITGYREGFFDSIRAPSPIPQDDVDIVWHLSGRAPSLHGRAPRYVVLPADHRSLPTAVAVAERHRIRGEMRELLSRGYVGTDVMPPSDGVAPRARFVRTRPV